MAIEKLCFIFPGQGSQYVGMGYSLSSKFPAFESIFLETLREADSALGFPLSTIIREGPAEKLKETEITQPALLTVSTAMSRWLKSHASLEASLVMGHSLGEFSALVHAESMTFRDAVKAVQARGRFMQQAVPLGEGSMAALIGATEQSARDLCAKVSQPGSLIEVSLVNAPGQIVISGHRSAIERASEFTKDFQIRKSVPLEVSGPFHCSLLRSAGDELFRSLQEITMSIPRIPVLSNVTAQIEEIPDVIRQNLRRQVYETVLWDPSVRNAHQRGVRQFVEVGAGTVLTGLVKKILPESQVLALETISDIEDLRKFAAS